MADNEQDPVRSALTQIATRDGKSVSIEIFSDGDGRWLLEVVDEHGNSAVWNLPFDKEQDALNAALTTIEAEGIDAFIGEPPERPSTQLIQGPLSEAEFEELDDFLASPSVEACSMDIANLEGFLTAIAIGPHLVMPSQWLPWVWDMVEGETEPEFASQEEAKQICSLVMRLYNGVVDALAARADTFEPVFHFGGERGATEWCEGFLLGILFDEENWNLLMLAQPTWFTPFMRLGTEEGLDLIAQADDKRTWIDAIEPSLMHIHVYWLERRLPGSPGAGFSGLGAGKTQVRAAPKIGRNDPCPCGSGKKYKKCCGENGPPPVLH